MEADGFRPRHEFSRDPDAFLAVLPPAPVVITWGFGPFPDRRQVGRLRRAGYRLVWLDGDRVASFREFMRREGNDPVRECDFYGQMQMITATEIADRLAAPAVNPFRSGCFRPIAEVAADVLAAAGASS